ncbi:peptide deformylase [Pleomorphomonas carboxyditropha]|uniref:Peptide deformylase n=1 Tax=Pleomorphomonas carboxyditropha TaxID=2023338 RepID=A0A2G9WT98_9HYPH|nr:peptide deformylase [Pleomorphomonas carboxyditropha]PIO97360.1 peptide deformylase [Pleomorphomonas carboxyditropha]
MTEAGEDHADGAGRASIVTGSRVTLQIEDSVLRMVAKPVPEEMFGSDVLRRLVEEMWMCMIEAGGVGIAAPQVGISWRLFIASARDHLPSTVFVNPEVEFFGAADVAGEEGCLSIPGWRSGKVPRHEKVRVRYRDMDGAARTASYEGIAARIVQHEFDHLNGRLFIDLDDSPDADDPPRRRARMAIAEMEARIRGGAPSEA